MGPHSSSRGGVNSTTADESVFNFAGMLVHLGASALKGPSLGDYSHAAQVPTSKRLALARRVSCQVRVEISSPCAFIPLGKYRADSTRLAGRVQMGNGMSEQDVTAHERFVQDIIASQGMLYAFILGLTADRDWADEVLQETNVVLLRKEDDFSPGTNFKAWANSVAYYQVLTSRKTRQRNRLIFDEQLMQSLSSKMQPTAEDHEARKRALHQCLDGLSASQSKLLQRRYRGESVSDIANEVGRSVGVISQTLYRARQALKDCINRKLTPGGAK